MPATVLASEAIESENVAGKNANAPVPPPEGQMGHAGAERMGVSQPEWHTSEREPVVGGARGARGEARIAGPPIAAGLILLLDFP